jgi:hypothetical protein
MPRPIHVLGRDRAIPDVCVLWMTFALMLVGLSLPGAAHAGINRWTTRGPGNGTILALAVDPTTPPILYAGGPDGGVFKSLNYAGCSRSTSSCARAVPARAESWAR